MINWDNNSDFGGNRDEYFRLLKPITSPLALLNKELLNKLSEINETELSKPADIHFEIIDALKQVGSTAALSRAEFIRLQCTDVECDTFFNANCESWGIPLFQEDILNASDFKFGFLYRFRDHSTSWNEDYRARNWFYNHLEARFANNWQFWICDNGPDELLYTETGNYKSLLYTLAKKYEDYEALKSPVFTTEDLNAFAIEHGKQNKKMTIEELTNNYLIENPNWVED